MGSKGSRLPSLWDLLASLDMMNCAVFLNTRASLNTCGLDPRLVHKGLSPLCTRVRSYSTVSVLRIMSAEPARQDGLTVCTLTQAFFSSRTGAPESDQVIQFVAGHYEIRSRAGSLAFSSPGPTHLRTVPTGRQAQAAAPYPAVLQ